MTVTEETAGTSHLLSVQGLCAGYGKVTAIDDIDIHVDAGEGVGIVGHNGAGKSTLLSAIFGTQQIWRGSLVFDGKRANNAPCSNPLPFVPSLTTGSTNVQAGAFTPFTLTMTRESDQRSSGSCSIEIPDGRTVPKSVLFVWCMILDPLSFPEARYESSWAR